MCIPGYVFTILCCSSSLSKKWVPGATNLSKKILAQSYLETQKEKKAVPQMLNLLKYKFFTIMPLLPFGYTVHCECNSLPDTIGFSFFNQDIKYILMFEFDWFISLLSFLQK